MRRFATANLRIPLAGVAQAAPVNVVSTVKHVKTSSGLEIVTVDAATSFSGAAVAFRAGSRFETPLTHGAASQLAALLRAGNASGLSAVASTRALLQTATTSYASAHRETLSYAVEFSRDQQADVLKLLGHVVRPLARSWEVQDALPQIEEEAHEALSDTSSLVDSAHWVAFRGSDLARSPNPSSPKADHVALQKYRDRFLNRNNAVVVGVGVEHELFVAEAEAAFAGLPSGSAASNSSKTVYVGGESHVESDGEPLFVLAFESGGLSSRDFLVASVLQEVLGRTPDRLFNKPRPGDGLSSRLNRALGPEAAVVFAESFVSSYSDAGLFGVQVQALSGHENTVLSAVSEELAKLAKSPLAEAELNGAKLRLKHSILKGSEQVDMRAHFFARQALYSDKVLCRSDYVSRIDSINAGEVQQFVAKILKGKRTLVSEGNSANYKN